MYYKTTAMNVFNITGVEYQNDRMIVKTGRPSQIGGSYAQSRIQLQFYNVNTGLNFQEQYNYLYESIGKTVNISTNTGKSVAAAINYQDVSNYMQQYLRYNRDNPQDLVSQLDGVSDSEYTFTFTW